MGFSRQEYWSGKITIAFSDNWATKFKTGQISKTKFSITNIKEIKMEIENILEIIYSDWTKKKKNFKATQRSEWLSQARINLRTSLMVKNPAANAGDTGSIPGPHDTKQLSLCTVNTEPTL